MSFSDMARRDIVRHSANVVSTRRDFMKKNHYIAMLVMQKLQLSLNNVICSWY